MGKILIICGASYVPPQGEDPGGNPNLPSSGDITSSLTWELGQTYGTVGSAISIDPHVPARTVGYIHTKVFPSDGISQVAIKLANDAAQPSSLLQWVDDYDTIIHRAVTHDDLSLTEFTTFDISYPPGATALYINIPFVNAEGSDSFSRYVRIFRAHPTKNVKREVADF